MRPARRPGGQAAREAPEPPPRPPVWSDLPPPAPPVVPPRPAVLTLSIWFWSLSALAGLVAVGAAGLDRDRLRDSLTDSARADDPGAADDLLRDGVEITVISLALVSGVLLIVTLWSLALVRRRRPTARWVLLLTGLLTLVAVDIDQGLVAGGDTDVDRIAFLVQGGLVLLGILTLLAPASGRWVRAETRPG